MADLLHHDVPDSNPILAKYFFRFFFSIPFFYKFFTHICRIILWPTEWIVTNTRTYMVTKSYQEYQITCVNSILWLKNPINYNRIYTKTLLKNPGDTAAHHLCKYLPSGYNTVEPVQEGERLL